MSKVGLCVMAVAVIAAYCLAAYWNHAITPPSLVEAVPNALRKQANGASVAESLSSLESLAEGEVPWEEWIYETDPVAYPRSVASRRLPCVLVNGPPTFWNATLRWNEQYFGKYLPTLTTFEHSEQEYMYENLEKPLAALQLGDRARVVSRKLASAAFFQKLAGLEAGKKGGPLVPQHMLGRVANQYSSVLGSFTEDSPWHILRDEVSPRWFLCPEDRSSENSNVWLTGKGAVCHTHHDSAHNFYFLLKGMQRVWLWPPSASEVLRPYPHLHSRSGQSQLHDMGPALGALAFTDSQGVAYPVQALLTELEGLYVPPLWFYRIESLERSIAVNTWSLAMEDAAVGFLLDMVPPELVVKKQTDVQRKVMETRAWDDFTNQRVSAAQVSTLQRYLAMLLLEVKGEAWSSWLEERLLRSRYGHYQAKLPLCLLAQAGEPLNQTHFDHNRCPEPVRLPAAVTDKAVEFLNKLAKINGAANCDIVLLNFVENLTERLVGVERACGVWRCLMQSADVRVTHM